VSKSAPSTKLSLSLLRTSLPAGEAGALPRRMVLMPWGKSVTNKGTFIVDERTAAGFDRNQAAIKRPTIKGDFMHESARKDVPHPIKFAVKRAVPKCVRGEGIVVEDCEWTKEGQAHCPEHYSDLSATPYHDDEGVVLALHSFAVCDHGEVDGMEINLAELRAEMALLSAAIPNPTQPTTPKPMNPILLLSLLMTKLGATSVPAVDATEAEWTAAINGLNLPTAAPAQLSATDPVIAGLTAKITTLSTEVDTLRGAQAGSAINRLLDAAVMQGKLVTLSAEDLTALGEDRAKAYLDKLPAGQVPIEQRTPVILSAGPSFTPGHDAGTVQAYKDLGLPLPDKK
jgi:phage I-like protein